LSCVGDNCPDVLHQPQSMTFVTTVPFPLGSALLTNEAKYELLQLLIELETFSVVEGFEVIGHTDASGPEDFNVWLSNKRAERVKEFFAQSGVDPRTVDYDGIGSSQPIAGAIDPA